MAKKFEGFENNFFDETWNTIRPTKVIDIYRLKLIKELEKVFEKEDSDIIRFSELKYLSTGMLEKVMIDYGLGDKIEARYITYNKNEV